MMRKIILLVACMSLLTSVAYGGWLIGSQYRKAIAITGASGAGTDYQVAITVYPGNGSDAPGIAYLNNYAHYFPNDIYFTAADGTTVLPHYRVPGTNDFFVKVADNLDTDKTIYIYFGLTGGDAVKVAPTSYDATMEFRHITPSAPILAVGAPGEWDDFWVSIHSVVKSGDTWYAYYHGYRSTMHSRVGLATSTDGTTWTKHPSNPIFTTGTAGQWDDDSSQQPVVWIEGATWYMLYAGARATGTAPMGLATSTDGISWTRSPSNPVLSPGGVGTWDYPHIMLGTAILKEGSTYYMFYTGRPNGADYDTYKIGYATSTDLINWTKYAGNPVLSGAVGTWARGVLEPHVRKFGSTYYMWFQGNEGVGSPPDPGIPDRSRIGLATSPDLNTWTAVSYPIFESDSVEGWDDFWHEAPVLVDFGTHWRMFYSASPVAGIPQMQSGMAVYERLGDPNNAFLLYDSFNRSSGINSAKWLNDGIFTQNYSASQKYASNTNTNYILRSQADFAYPIAIQARTNVDLNWSSEYGRHFGISWDNGLDTSGISAAHESAAGYNRWIVKQSPTGTNQVVAESISADTPYTIGLRITATQQYLDVNGALKAQIATTPPQATSRVELLTGRGSSTSNYTTYFDYVFARKYNAIEPVVGTPGVMEAIFTGKISNLGSTGKIGNIGNAGKVGNVQ